MNAYVMILGDGNGELLAERLEAIPDVVWAEDLTGAYDAIALARSSSTRDLADRVIEKIRRLPGVTRALPAPLVEPPAGHPRTVAPGRSLEHAAA